MTTPLLNLYPSAPLEKINDIEQSLEKKLNDVTSLTTQLKTF